jgi:Putative auto-transporter adhesin, head GIN domain
LGAQKRHDFWNLVVKNQKIMLKKTVFLYCVFFLLGACQKLEEGSGEIVVKSFQLADFQELIFKSNYQMDIYSSSDTCARIEFSDYENLIQNATETLHQAPQQLILYPRSKRFKNSQLKVNLYLHNPNLLKRLKLEGFSGKLILKANLPKLEWIECTESSQLVSEASLSLNDLVVQAKKNGHISLWGQANRIHINTQSVKDIDLKNLVGQAIYCDVDSSGSVFVNTNYLLSANVNNSGSVRYIGIPFITKNIRGTGTVAPY